MQILIIYVTIVVVANILDKKNDIDILRILIYHQKNTIYKYKNIINIQIIKLKCYLIEF